MAYAYYPVHHPNGQIHMNIIINAPAIGKCNFITMHWFKSQTKCYDEIMFIDLYVFLRCYLPIYLLLKIVNMHCILLEYSVASELATDSSCKLTNVIKWKTACLSHTADI